jgi:hypothetical protein
VAACRLLRDVHDQCISAAFMQSYTVFLVAFIETFGWSRGEASVAYAVSQFECRANPQIA